MKQFKFKAKDGKADINVTLTDLIPIKHAKSYTFTELVRFINYSDYYTVENWNTNDFDALYKIPAHKKSDFFKIKDTDLIVIPGQYLFPTTLTEDEIL